PTSGRTQACQPPSINYLGLGRSYPGLRAFRASKVMNTRRRGPLRQETYSQHGPLQALYGANLSWISKLPFQRLDGSKTNVRWQVEGNSSCLCGGKEAMIFALLSMRLVSIFQCFNSWKIDLV